MDETTKTQDKQDEIVVNMQDLKGILSEAIKNMDLPQIMEMKEQIKELDRKAIFPSGDGSMFETYAGSIVNLGAFQKGYTQQEGNFNSIRLQQHLTGGKGPFLKLSPVMEKFAFMCRCRGDLKLIESKGKINIAEYNAEVLESYKGLGWDEKALTTTDAGAIVPVEYMATVVEFATQQSQLLSKVWRMPMASNLLKIPKLVQAAGSYFGGITLYHPGEGELKTDTKPSFDTLTFTAKKTIGLIPLTDELIADSAINIINYITTLTTRAFVYNIEGEIITGTGIGNQMTGIINDPVVIAGAVARQTAGTVKYDDLLNLESALDENFQDLTYLSRRATINTFRGQKAAAGSDAVVYQDGYVQMFGAKIPPQLLGNPLLLTRNVPAMGMRGDIIVGDFNYYIWALRQDMTIDSDKSYRYAYDETTLRFVMRMDGAPGVSEAFAILEGNAS